MVGTAGFHERDGARQGGALTRLQARGQDRGVEAGLAQMRTAVPEIVTISIEPLAPTVS
jgi:hypothetical protein